MSEKALLKETFMENMMGIKKKSTSLFHGVGCISPEILYISHTVENKLVKTLQMLENMDLRRLMGLKMRKVEHEFEQRQLIQLLSTVSSPCLSSEPPESLAKTMTTILVFDNAFLSLLNTSLFSTCFESM